MEDRVKKIEELVKKFDVGEDEVIEFVAALAAMVTIFNSSEEAFTKACEMMVSWDEKTT